MDNKQFKIVKFFIVIAMGAGIGAAVAETSPLIAIAAWFAGLFAILLLRKRYVRGEVEKDEMTGMIAGKAAYLTVMIAAPALAVGGMALIAAREVLPAYEMAGYAMAYTSVGLLLLQVIFVTVFYRKMAD
ncbi:DUF2178 domain-containing protein [Methanofollis formosanus]|uniref:DUF2178 domain-containing protein n=1 Tax=Methanofollis formosanus TaxID=299308 RepID=A0A8G1EGI6_9EURY|nr:DUF2178 domain-containing protein [Methanofollis formosanus]QYZ79214.1 DUF2178 domain-containing protein [Methanofollis formosanus]